MFVDGPTLALIEAFNSPVNHASFASAQKVAKARQVHVLAVALAAVTSTTFMAIIGRLNSAHLDDALRAADLSLAEAEFLTL